jgi:hypothetical protein
LRLLLSNRRLEIQREIHNRNVTLLACFFLYKCIKFCELIFYLFYFVFLTIKEAEKVVKSIRNSQENLDLMNKSNKSNVSIFSDKNNSLEDKQSDKKELNKSKNMNKTSKSVSSSKHSTKMSSKSSKIISSENLLYRAELKVIENKYIHRSTSINPSDLNYIQLNAYSKLKIFLNCKVSKL